MVELRIPRDGNKTNRRITSWNFRTEDYDLFSDLLGKKFMGHGPGKKRGLGQLVDFKDHFLQAQEWSMPMSRKPSNTGRRPARTKKLLLTKLKGNIQEVELEKVDTERTETLSEHTETELGKSKTA